MSDHTAFAEKLLESFLDDRPRACAIRLLSGIIERQEVPRGTLLLGQGQMSRELWYVEKGLLRQFYFKGGHEVTEHFTAEQEVCFCTESLFLGLQSQLLVETLEDCVLYRIPYQALMDLTAMDHQIYRSYCRFLEWCLMISQDKADTLRKESALESYRHFLKEYPRAARSAPHKHIASYLTITPETLSRILRAEGKDREPKP